MTDAPKQSADAAPDKKPPRRWRPRFSLRTLTLCVLLFAAGIGLQWRCGPWVVRAEVPGGRFAVFTPDDRFLLNFESKESAVQAWDVRSGRLAERWTGVRSSLQFVRVSEDGRFVTGYAPGDQDPFAPPPQNPPPSWAPQILMWTFGRSEPLADLPATAPVFMNGELEPVAVDSGRFILCPKASALWDVATKSIRWTLSPAPPSHLDFSAESQALIDAEREAAQARAMQAETLAAFAEAADGKAAFSFGASVSGSLLLTHVYRAKTAALWQIPNGRKLGEIGLPPEWDWIERAVFSEDGAVVAVLNADQEEARFYSTRSFEPQGLPVHAPLEADWCGFSPDGAIFFSFLNKAKKSRAKVLTVWEVATGQAVRALNAEYPFANDLDLHSNRIVAADIRRALTLRGMEHLSVTGVDTQSRLAWLPLPGDDYIVSATYSNDGNKAAVVLGEDRTMLLQRRRPEYWWGIAWLPEFWLTVVFALLLVWSLVRDVRQLRSRTS